MIIFVFFFSSLYRPDDRDSINTPTLLSEQVVTGFYLLADFNTNTNSINNSSTIGDNAQVAQTSASVSADVVRRVPAVSAGDDFAHFSDHPILLHHVTLTSVSGTTTITNDLVQMFETAISATPLGRKYENFAYFSGELCLRVVVQGTPFSAGKFMLCATPTPFVGVDGNAANSTPATCIGPGRVNAHIVPHIEIDPSRSDTYELKLPMCSASGNYTWRAAAQSGSYKLDLVLINPIISGTAVAGSASVCIYMHIANPVLQGITLASADSNFESEQTTWKLSSLVRQTAGVSNAIGGIFPSVSPWTTIYSAVAGTAADVLSFFGFSKPPQHQIDTLAVTRFGDNYSAFEGRSGATVLSGTPANSLSIDPAYGAAHGDDMLIANIISRPGLVQTVSMAPANASGTLLATLAVQPQTIVAESGGPAGFGYIPMCGIAAMFTYWTGDILVDIEVIASVFHRGTILVAWDPTSPIAPPTLSQAVQTLQNTTIAISGRSKVRIRIPWKQVQNYKTSTFRYANTTTPATENGLIYIFVVNPLTSNGSTDSVGINVFYSSDNMKFFAPTAVDLYPTAADAVLASGDTMVEFGPKTDLSKSALRAFGEEYHSVKQLTSRMYPVYSEAGTIGTTSTTNYFGLRYPNYPYVRASSNSNGNHIGNPSSWIARAFMGYRGGMRFSFHATSSEDNVEVVMDHMWSSHLVDNPLTLRPDTFAIFTLSTLAALPQQILTQFAFGLGNRSIAPMCDAIVPASHGLDFVPTRSFHTTWYDTVAFYVHSRKPAAAPETNNVQCTLFAGTADDGVFLKFLGFPLA